MLIGPPWLHSYQHMAPFLLAFRLVTSTSRSRAEGGVAPCKQSTSRWLPVDANLLPCGLDHGMCSFRVGCATLCIPCSYYWCTCCAPFSMDSTTSGVVLIPADCATPSIPCSRAVFILASRGCGFAHFWHFFSVACASSALWWVASLLAVCVGALCRRRCPAFVEWKTHLAILVSGLEHPNTTPRNGSPRTSLLCTLCHISCSVTNGRPCRSGHAFVVDSATPWSTASSYRSRQGQRTIATLYDDRP